jgi:hypothetical protein
MTDRDFFDDLQKLIEQDAPPLLVDGDITAKVVAERATCGWSKALRMLEKWERDGKVESIGERRDARGRRVRAWRMK